MTNELRTVKIHPAVLECVNVEAINRLPLLKTPQPEVGDIICFEPSCRPEDAFQDEWAYVEVVRVDPWHDPIQWDSESCYCCIVFKLIRVLSDLSVS